MATFRLTTGDGSAAVLVLPGAVFMFMFFAITIEEGVAAIYRDVAMIVFAIAPTSAYIFA